MSNGLGVPIKKTSIKIVAVLLFIEEIYTYSFAFQNLFRVLVYVLAQIYPISLSFCFVFLLFTNGYFFEFCKIERNKEVFLPFIPDFQQIYAYLFFKSMRTFLSNRPGKFPKHRHLLGESSLISPRMMAPEAESPFIFSKNCADFF